MMADVPGYNMRFIYLYTSHGIKLRFCRLGRAALSRNPTLLHSSQPTKCTMFDLAKYSNGLEVERLYRGSLESLKRCFDVFL